MKYIAYMFELKSIQSYLMAGGKLKDMVNSSDLLEQFTQENGYLDIALKMSDIQIPDTNDGNNQGLINFSRRAGGAIYLIAQESYQGKLQVFRLLWTLLVQQILPDSEFVDCLTEPCDNAFESVKQGRKQLLQQRSIFYPALPLSTPFTQLASRTGTAAVGVDPASNEWLDKANMQKRAYQSAKSNLTTKFCVDDHYKWPSSLETGDFPYLTDEKDIAIVHIDGNGLGQVLINMAAVTQESNKNIADGYIKFYATFSNELKKATERAAQEATKEVLIEEWMLRQDSSKKVNKTYLAARPLVLGGDDLTIIIRADLAIEFSRVFIEAFEKHSANIKNELFKTLKKYYKSDKQMKAKLPELLTACGGIVFQKASQPFMMGYTLAESLCASAKGASKEISSIQIPSSVCFYQIQSSVTDNYTAILEQELTTADKQLITLGAYGLGQYQDNQLPKLMVLQGFVKNLQNKEFKGVMAKLRQWLGLLLIDNNAAVAYYDQMDKTLRLQNRGNTYDQLVNLLNNFLGQKELDQMDNKLNWFKESKSPLLDLITLNNLAIKEERQ